MKPKVFVASSVEGLNVAYPIQVNLQHDADLTIWSQGVFSLSETSLDSIINALDASDFGVFVFSPDDETKMRGNVSDAVRDNVLFELGLFVGRIGKRRCFIVMPDNVNLHIPTDLIGVTPATYSGERDISEISASLGPACHAIREEMKKHGCLSDKNNTQIKLNEFEGYDDNDKIILLEAWLINERKKYNGLAITYTDIDNLLKLEPGTSKQFLPEIIDRTPNYSLVNQGNNVFRYTYTSPPVRIKW